MQRNAGTIKVDYFQEILACARLRDQERLNALLQINYFSLDMLEGTAFGLLTPAGMLELFEEHDAADFLRENGADPDYMGYGAALVGKSNRMRCEFLRKFYGSSPSFIAKGAAVAGDMDYVDELYLCHGAGWYDIVLGCVVAGNPLRALKFIEKHLSSIIFIPDHLSSLCLIDQSHFSAELVEAFWEYMIDVNLFYADEYNQLEGFWRAVGIGNVKVDDNLLQLWRFLKPSRYALTTSAPWSFSIYYGMGLAGRTLDEEADLTLNKYYYKGAVHGNHNDLIPEELYIPEPGWKYLPIDFDPALCGRNLAFIEGCFAANKESPEITREIDRWLAFYAIVSQDAQIIRHSHTYNFHFKDQLRRLISGRSYTLADDFVPDLPCRRYKSLSLIHAHVNRFCLRNLRDIDFFNMLPNEQIATHFMAFDVNDKFQQELLARYQKFNLDESSDYYVSRCDYNFPRAYANARKMRVLMHKYQFNYDQALAIIKSKDSRNFILNACRDITNYVSKDLSAYFVFLLSDLGLTDASGLIDKVRYYRLIVDDILTIAGSLQNYADQHNSEQSQHAKSLAQTLQSTRSNNVAVDALSQEFDLISQANQTRGAQLMNDAAPALQSIVGFFGGVRLQAKKHKNKLRHHEQAYTMPVVKDGYETLVSTSLQTLRAKFRD